MSRSRAVQLDPRQGPQLVRIAVAKPAVASERTFTGLIAARVQSNLGFRVPGKMVERLVDVGQEVHAGQPLMRLDQKDLALALAARENAVAAARAAAVQARDDEVRYRQLAADGWASRQRYEQAKAAFDTAAAQLAAAEAQANVARNEAGYSLLLADADGTVVETLAEPGQVVAAGQTVVKLAHAGPREALVNLPETVRPAIGSAAQAAVYGEAIHPLAGTSPAARRTPPIPRPNLRGALRPGWRRIAGTAGGNRHRHAVDRRNERWRWKSRWARSTTTDNPAASGSSIPTCRPSH